VTAYVLVSVTALLRVFTVLVAPALYLELIAWSGGVWVLAFALFVIVYASKLVTARPDGRPG
jgi:uncharacterized protein involved in response to NO